jgi:hypothetical protein
MGTTVGDEAKTNRFGQTLFDDIIAAWDAAEIFGMWLNGNIGPACSTSGAPGNRPVAYSTGAYDINNKIAEFSSRGPGLGSDIKPNISAPGVNIRSALPNSKYGNMSGTSMASPHVSGAVALLWAAAPRLRGDIDGTKRALDRSGVDVRAGQCRRLDALTLPKRRCGRRRLLQNCGENSPRVTADPAQAGVRVADQKPPVSRRRYGRKARRISICPLSLL